MATEETEQELRGALQVVVVIVFILIFGGFGYAIYYSMDSPSENMHEFCKSQNYTKATSFKSYYPNNVPYTFKIICDDDEVFKVIFSDGCDKYDKYEDCIYPSSKLVKYDDGIRGKE